MEQHRVGGLFHISLLSLLNCNRMKYNLQRNHLTGSTPQMFSWPQNKYVHSYIVIFMRGLDTSPKSGQAYSQCKLIVCIVSRLATDQAAGFIGTHHNSPLSYLSLRWEDGVELVGIELSFSSWSNRESKTRSTSVCSAFWTVTKWSRLYNRIILRTVRHRCSVDPEIGMCKRNIRISLRGLDASPNEGTGICLVLKLDKGPGVNPKSLSGS